jgi:arylsulfatase A-like enzyme
MFYFTNGVQCRGFRDHFLDRNVPLARSFVSLFFIGFILLFMTDSARAQQGPSQRPNVLFLMADDHRADVLGIAGDPYVLTPNLDRLANDGVRFTHFASQSPICVPSRASIMTGMYDMTHNVNGFTPMDVGTTYLAEWFVNAGYATGYAGKWHLNGAGLRIEKDESYVPPDVRRGFQEWDGYDGGADHDRPLTFDETQSPPAPVEVEGYDWTPTYYRDVFLEFAERHGNGTDPWMYFLSYALPHQPAEAPQEFLDLFPPEDFDLFGMAPELIGNITPEEEAGFRGILQAYYAQVSFLDQEIGLVLEGLDELGLAENTIVVYFSDHGQLLGSHFPEVQEMGSLIGDEVEIFFRAKSLPFARAFRAPLIIRWPGMIPPANEVDVLMNMVDLPATVLDLARLGIPSTMQGNSMRDWCLGGVGPDPDGVYLNLSIGDTIDWQAVWTGNYVYCSTDGLEILYDHINDPMELNNLFFDPAYSDVRLELQQMLDELALSTTAFPRESSGGSGNCFVQTAAMGSGLENELDGIRSFRDSWLLNNPAGRTVADAYYKLSPAAAHWISAHDSARSAARGILWLLLDGAKYLLPMTGLIAVAIGIRTVRA